MERGSRQSVGGVIPAERETEKGEDIKRKRLKIREKLIKTIVRLNLERNLPLFVEILNYLS